MASTLGVSGKTLSKIINERGAITPDMALRLGRAFDTTPELWMNFKKNMIYGWLNMNQKTGKKCNHSPLINFMQMPRIQQIQLSRPGYKNPVGYFESGWIASPNPAFGLLSSLLNFLDSIHKG